jgi:DNA-binding MarR family transcriptional regulator
MARASAEPQKEISEFTQNAVMSILRIMGKLRHPGVELPMDVELSYAQILVLYALLETGKATMGELAQWLQVTQGVVTRIVDRLVEKGMVVRSGDEADRRVVLVSLSPEGRAYAEKMIAMHLDKMNRVFMNVGKKDREAFLDLLKRIDEQLGT